MMTVIKYSMMTAIILLGILLGIPMHNSTGIQKMHRLQIATDYPSKLAHWRYYVVRGPAGNKQCNSCLTRTQVPDCWSMVTARVLVTTRTLSRLEN